MAQPALVPVLLFPPGARVSHRLFGEGTVLRRLDSRLEVCFDDYGSMLLPPSLTSLEESATEAPRVLDRHAWNGIKAAIREEARLGSRPVECEVRSAWKDGPLWRVEVTAEGLEESLEGARAWWPEPGKGSAEVVAVRPEEGFLWLRNATAAPPGAGRTLYLYPPEFYGRLLAAWEDEAWAAQSLEWLDAMDSGRNECSGRVLDPHPYPWLRRAQRSSFALPAWRYARLHGPPGTGKTTTLGALLAAFLLERPNARVLLVSSTNTAVDQALLAVDRQLDNLSDRPRCQRIGWNFDSALYLNREHLLPDQCGHLLDELAGLEQRGATGPDAHAYTAWKDEITKVRGKLRAKSVAALKKTRLAAMTVARALLGMAELKDRAPWDLLVFDEASQVSLAQALILQPLARSVLFAGDPQQLAPVFRSRTGGAEGPGERWLGRTAFDLAEHEPSTVFLDEQSRMAEPISRLISDVFYHGRLRVAEGALHDPAWHAGRAGHCARLIPMDSDGAWSPLYGGMTRLESAQAMARRVEQLVSEVAPERIAVVTPFRAQRELVRHLLRQRGLSTVLVTTAHGVQGGERHTVLFDPVDGAGRFLRLGSLAARLVNVALSRAQSRLYVYLSEKDRRNPVLAAVAARLRHDPEISLLPPVTL